MDMFLSLWFYFLFSSKNLVLRARSEIFGYAVTNCDKCLKWTKVWSDLKLRYSANQIKPVERSDSTTLGTLDHFSHFTLIGLGCKPLPGATQSLALWARIFTLRCTFGKHAQLNFFIKNNNWLGYISLQQNCKAI